jgi:hypothetical protein
MRMASAAIAAAVGGVIAGACAPMAAEDGSLGSASCAGTCDGAGEGLELLYGERREVGPVGDFGITAEWTDHAELVVAAGARARLVLEPHGFGELPQLTVYRDLGTSIEYVAETFPGVAELELLGDDERTRYLVEIYGAPEASQGAILELQCAAGECGPEVEVTISEQVLRSVPTEIRELVDDDWHLFRVGANREDFAEKLPVARIADRIALAPESFADLEGEAGVRALSATRKLEVELSEVEAYPGGDPALDAFAHFLDPEGHRFELRYGEARMVYEMVEPDGDAMTVVQEVPVLLLRSRGVESDLAVALDRRWVR